MELPIFQIAALVTGKALVTAAVHVTQLFARADLICMSGSSMTFMNGIFHGL